MGQNYELPLIKHGRVGGINYMDVPQRLFMQGTNNVFILCRVRRWMHHPKLHAMLLRGEFCERFQKQDTLPVRNCFKARSVLHNRTT